jgi:catechol 2,3-dioxygenase-like lactoylglutathione lyase family enzyme
MFDHIGFSVTDLERSKAFYSAALQPVGVMLLMEITAEQTGSHAHAGYGAGDKAFFWIGDGEALSGSVHVAFKAEARAAVDAFYAAALAAGGKDNGPPGLRPHYGAEYYGAFVLDPDGHNIEAVCRLPG